MSALRCAALPLLCLAAVACSDGIAPAAPGDIGLSLTLQAAEGISTVEGAALGEAFDRVDRYRIRVEEESSRTVYADTVIRVVPGTASHDLTVALPESALGASLRVTLTALDGETQLFTATVFATATRAGSQGGAATEVGVRYTGPGLRGSVTGNDGQGAGGVPVQVLRAGQVVATATTAGDGSYLLMDLGAGTYTVRVPTQPGLATCPGERTVTLGGATPSAVAAFQYRVGGCTVRVLVVSGGDVDDTGAAAALLAGVPDLQVETFFFVSRTPGIERLRAFDVVLLYQNGIFNESSTLGSELAQFVELGGNVVFGSFYWQGRSDGGLESPGWGSLEGVDPFASAGGAGYTASTLGSTSVHPLTSGVATLSSSGFRGGVTARAGTSVVATWADGVPLAGYRVSSVGQRLVGVSLFPAHASVGGVSGDYVRLWQNAVVWAGQAGGPARTGPVPGVR